MTNIYNELFFLLGMLRVLLLISDSAKQNIWPKLQQTLPSISYAAPGAGAPAIFSPSIFPRRQHSSQQRNPITFGSYNYNSTNLKPKYFG
jgi:hypothetical protein